MELVAGAARPQSPRAQFEDFVTARGDRLLPTAYGLCGDWQHAEDLVQQVLLTMAGRWERITADPTGYAYRCLARANIDRWRVTRRRPEFIADPALLKTMQPREWTLPGAGISHWPGPAIAHDVGAVRPVGVSGRSSSADVSR